MPGTAGDALLASADADKVSKVSDLDAPESGRLPRLVDSTVISDPDGFAGTVGFPRLLATGDANRPEVLKQLAGMLVFQAESTTKSDHLLLTAADPKTNLTICEEDGTNSSFEGALMFPDMIRSLLGFYENQQMRDSGYFCMSSGTFMYMDGIDCYIWKFSTGEPLMLLPFLGLVNPFPPLHSGIVQATATWPLRALIRYGEGTWCCQPWRDWPSLPDLVLEEMLSYVDCTEDFHAVAYTCQSWYLAASFYPRPLLLHPYAHSTWLFVTPGGRRKNSIGNFLLFPALRMEERSTLIGGSTKFLIFLDGSSCYIVNIRTGKRKELQVPCFGVQRGVLSTPADSANSKILLVTATSVVCKSVNDTDEWKMQDFGDIYVGPIDDIVFVGETAYMIDNRSCLFIISPGLEISQWNLQEFYASVPSGMRRKGFGRAFRSNLPKLIIRKNWLLEHHGQLLRLYLMSCTLDTKVCFGFFLTRIGSHDMYKWLTKKFPGKKFPSEAWIEMRSADFGDNCVFVNNGPSVASFVSEISGRWGLKSGQVFMCGPEVFPWLSFDLGWASEDDIIPENIQWPCPVFMHPGFSFTAAEELDHSILQDNAPEPTALNLDSAASSSRNLQLEGQELSSHDEAN